MLEEKVKERIADWLERKAKNAKLLFHKRIEESQISLDLSECEISNLDFILNLEGVIDLRLNNNLIEDVTPLTKIAGLESLFLYNNLIRDALPLLKCESLRNLNLINNKLPLIYGKQKRLFREKFPDAQIHWDGRTRTPNLFG
jgi:hypothetical protein